MHELPRIVNHTTELTSSSAGPTRKGSTTTTIKIPEGRKSKQADKKKKKRQR
jgi:hypothetical protein